MAQSAGAADYTVCNSAEIRPPLRLENAEYPFIPIAPRSILTLSGNTW